MEIESKTAEKNSAQTNRQTDRQTDTTKIMVTWPSTNSEWTLVCSVWARVATFSGAICLIMPNFVAIGRTIAEMWRLTVLKMAAVCRLGF